MAMMRLRSDAHSLVLCREPEANFCGISIMFFCSCFVCTLADRIRALDLSSRRLCLPKRSRLQTTHRRTRRALSFQKFAVAN